MRAGNLTTREAWNQMYNVNVTSTQILTEMFAPLLIQSSSPRLLFLGSGLSQLQNMQKAFYPGPAPLKGWPKQPSASPDGYRTSKTALNMVMLSWYWTLKEDGVKVWGINPGFLATNLGNNREKLKVVGAKCPSLGGSLVVQVIEGQRDSDMGKIVLAEGVQLF
jgi:NAD(P)-dependent dehydrogenase (short-subunit alcohol dehydrogenase family)